MNKFNKYIYIFIFSIISVLVFLIDFRAFDTKFLTNTSGVVNFFVEINQSIKNFNIMYVALWIFILYFYNDVYFNNKKYDNKCRLCTIIAIIFSIITIISSSYYIDNTLNSLYSSYGQIFKSIILVLGYYLIYYAILKKIMMFKLNFNIKKKNKILEYIDKYPFRASLILIGLMWLPYIIVSFPGLSTSDTLDEVAQFFHRDISWSIDSINLLSEDMYINKHHSVFHVVIMGLIFKLGKMLGTFTIGAFIYIVLQVLLLLIIFSFMIKYMKKIRINNLIILLSILFVGLNPTVVTFAICAIKDTPSSIFNLLYVIFLLQIVRNFDSIYKNKMRVLGLFITILMVLLLRNNGIYTFVFSFSCLFLVYKKEWKRILLTILFPVLIFFVYNDVLLPKFNISDGSIREMLSIPVMQISRVIHHKPEVFTDKDKEIINKTFNFGYMERFYNPDISDDMKNTYNKDATKEELMDFFSVWFKYLKKYPSMYIESFVNSTYGYFFPGKNRDALYMVNFEFLKEPYFDIHSISLFNNVKKVWNQLLYIYYKVPFFINNVAYYDWILIFSCGYVIKKKKYKYLVPLSALLLVLLSCLASPLNGSFRYIMPIIFSVPVIISIDYLVYKESKKDIVN